MAGGSQRRSPWRASTQPPHCCCTSAIGAFVRYERLTFYLPIFLVLPTRYANIPLRTYPWDSWSCWKCFMPPQLARTRRPASPPALVAGDRSCHSGRWGRVAAIPADLKGAGGIKTALKGQISARGVGGVCVTGGAGPPVPSRRQPVPTQPTHVPRCRARPRGLFPTEGTEGTRSWSLVQAGQSLPQLLLRLLKLPPQGGCPGAPARLRGGAQPAAACQEQGAARPSSAAAQPMTWHHRL